MIIIQLIISKRNHHPCATLAWFASCLVIRARLLSATNACCRDHNGDDKVLGKLGPGQSGPIVRPTVGHRSPNVQSPNLHRTDGNNDDRDDDTDAIADDE